MKSLNAVTLIITVVVIILSGTVFFRIVEGWSWLDAYFFTVVTLSTVGYGELVPASPIGRIGTTVLIFLGLGTFAYAIQQFGQFTHRKRSEHTHSLLQNLLHARDKDPDPDVDVDVNQNKHRSD